MNPNQPFEEFKLELMAAYSDVCREEREKDKRLTERRRAAEDARIEKELMREFDYE